MVPVERLGEILGELLGEGPEERPGEGLGKIFGVVPVERLGEILGELLGEGPGGLIGEALARRGLSHPEKPVCGFLVQLRLTLLRSQAREVETTKGGGSVSAALGRGWLTLQIVVRLFGSWE